jgi:poly(U)-specific endoribonuclease
VHQLHTLTLILITEVYILKLTTILHQHSMTTTTKGDIYQQIWTADQNQNGIPAFLNDKSKADDVGYVIVNKKYDKKTDTKVFEKDDVKIPESKRDTYDKCLKLMDNYILDSRTNNNQSDKDSLRSEEETIEINDFIDAIKDTEPMNIARKEIEKRKSLSDDEWKDYIQDVWFKPFALSKNVKARSGFEHVFVGETGKETRKETALGGYHFWYKYYLDDNAGQFAGVTASESIKKRFDTDDIDLKDFKDVNGSDLVADFVALNFIWKAEDETNQQDDDKKETLVKPLGSFWVGLSPEGLMALGMVTLSTQKRTAVINSVEYNLVLREKDGKINSFFPKFKKVLKADPEPPREDTSDEDTDTEKETGVRISAALINPDGDGDDKESVTLRNTGQKDVDISGWTIEGNNGRRFKIGSKVLNPGQDHTFLRDGDNKFELKNRGGDIRLRNGEGAVID